MRTLKFDNYEIKTVKMNGKSNYELAVHIYKDDILITGGIMKTDSKDIDILEWAINSIKNYKPFSFAEL